MTVSPMARLEEAMTADLIYGAILSVQGSYSEATAHLRRVLLLAKRPAYRSVVDRFHQPFAQYELALLMMDYGAYKAAIEALAICRRYKPSYTYRRSVTTVCVCRACTALMTAIAMGLAGYSPSG